MTERVHFPRCETCGTIKAWTCTHCGDVLHPHYTGTLSGSGVSPWWYNDEDDLHCSAAKLHWPIPMDEDDVLRSTFPRCLPA